MRVSAVSVTSCVKPTVGMSPGAVGAAGSSGGGAVTPTDGTSPARAELERIQVRAMVMVKRFIEFFSFEVLAMQELLHLVRIEQLPELLASS